MLGRNHHVRAARGAKTRSLTFESLEARVVLSSQGLAAQAANPTASAVVAPQAAILSVVDWVHSLGYQQFNLLLPDQVQYLTTQQVASIPEIYWFSQMSAGARAALSMEQVQALKVSTIHLDNLTSQQVGYLTIAQIQSLTFPDFKYLSAAQTPSLTTGQIASIPDPGPFAEWTPAARAALTLPQIQALNVGSVWINQLTDQQVSWLTVPQIQSLRFADFARLSAAQTPYLTTSQIAIIPDPGPFATWSPAARAALTVPQIQSLNVGKVWINLLTDQQVAWLTAPQIQSLRQADLWRLPPDLTPILLGSQIAAIPDAGAFASWSAASRAALTTPQIQVLNVGQVGISLLTPQQVYWISPGQIQALRVDDFKYLSGIQTPYLTTAQIAAIPDPGTFASWSAAARAGLTSSQVQALRVADIWINLLTPQQVSYLTVPQIQSIRVADYQYLNALQVPYLTFAQIAAIPDAGRFGEWSSLARAALTQSQVPALNVANVRIDRLTLQQVAWLTASQIQSLRMDDFKFLNPFQVPYLTAAQIATIPDPGPFSAWSSLARSSLTATQVQALNVAKVWINLLTPEQISWLTVNQIRAVRWEHFALLNPDQVQFISTAQFASVPSGFALRTLPDEIQARFSRAQLLGLTSAAYAQYVSALAPPANYIPTVDIPVGPDGLAIDHSLHTEADRIFNLVPLAAATHVSIATGNWSDPNVWLGGRVPSAGAKVVISTGTAVRFDVSMNAAQAVKTLRIDGTLTFATNLNTQLYADTIVVYTTGKLHIGTTAAPIADHVTARVTITGGGPIDTTWDPYLLSRGLLSGGEVRMYGKAVAPYATLLEAPVRGATQLTFSQIPANWKVGDTIVLTGTHQYLPEDYQNETLIIRGIAGNVVAVDPLRYDHVPPAGFGLSLYAINTTRNIIFSAADSGVPPVQRPHIMFFHNPNVDVENVGVYGFGRTDKTIPINDPVVVNGVLQPGTGLNPRARYGMHFHHTGVNPSIAPAIVRGSLVSNSAGWGYVNHGSNVVMENNVSYNVAGAGFVAEDGNEIGVMRGNLALGSKGSGETVEGRIGLHDFGHGGHGFWLQGPGVAVVDNIAASHAAGAFVYMTSSSRADFDAVNMTDPSLAAGRKTVPVGMVPLKEFSGNTAMTSATGLEIWFNQVFLNDGQSYVDDFTSWNTRAAGIQLFYAGRLTIRNSTLVGDMTQFRGDGIFTNFTTHDISVVNDRIEGFENGIVVASRRANLIDNTVFNATRGINVPGASDTLRTLDISNSVTFKSSTAAQLKGEQQFKVFLDGKVDFTFRTITNIVRALTNADRIRITRGSKILAVMYFPEQAPDYVPFTTASARGIVPDEYLNLSNQQLRDRFGVSLGGGMPPADAVPWNTFRGLFDFTP